MKKRYTTPSIREIEVKAASMVCTSPGVGFGNGDYDGTMHSPGRFW